MMSPEAVVVRARACVGVRFRPQGRDPAYGLDCLGLVAVAYGVRDVPGDYALRGGHRSAIEAGLAARGFHEVDLGGAGDVALFEAAPGQFHLGIMTETGLIHADAGLRRVVERPGAFVWPILSVWRRPEEGSRCALAPTP